MHLMMKVKIPVEQGNKALVDGSMSEAFETVVRLTNAEAVYFTLEDGCRTALLFYELDDPSKLRQIREPLFHKLHAQIEEKPVMDWQEAVRTFKPRGLA